MRKKIQKSVFIFRRDLRLDDNTGLLAALEQSEQVLPVFIFDDRQTNQEQNKYFSRPAFSFLVNSLKELNEELRAKASQLYLFSGDPKKVIESLVKNDSVEAVFVNQDYTPFSKQRDGELKALCATLGAVFEQYSDHTLSPIESISTGTGKKYTVFTPFKHTAMGYPVLLPKANAFSNFYRGGVFQPTTTLHTFSISTGEKKLLLSGGRGEALAILKECDYLQNYQERRNFPSQHGTSRLSAHHKFGTISIRESYNAVITQSDPKGTYISELYWRDFYYYIAHHFPTVFEKSFLPWAELLRWTNNQEQFHAWCIGKTGVPIVDAGMRELRQTGWMHNRVRMIVASYLTKNLLINWQWGEKFFAQNLLDYDPAQNNGGWQWSASTGADPRPLRIFNPYLQAQKFDPQAEYIQEWVPELRQVDAKTLVDGKTQDFSQVASGYPAPLVDQKESYHRAIATYKQAKYEWKVKSEGES